MREWIAQHGWQMAAISVGLLVVSLAVGITVIIRMPADHFVREDAADGRHGLGKRILKNVAGMLLIVLGVVMSLPLVPGPGLVFLAVGISLTSFPGKKRFERMILRRRWVIGSINWIRERHAPSRATGKARETRGHGGHGEWAGVSRPLNKKHHIYIDSGLVRDTIPPMRPLRAIFAFDGPLFPLVHQRATLSLSPGITPAPSKTRKVAKVAEVVKLPTAKCPGNRSPDGRRASHL